MLKAFDKNRKVISVIVSAITIIIYLLIFFQNKSTDLLVFSSAISASILLIQIVLFFKGVPSAVSVSTYISFILIGSIIGIILKLNIGDLPEFVNPNITNSFIIGIIVFLTVGLHIPAKFKDKAEKHLGIERIERTHTFSQIVDDKTTYLGLLGIKGRKIVAARPYGYENISAFLRKFRIIVGCTLIGIGLLSLLIGANLTDTAENPLYSYVFWMCISGLFLASVGAFIMILGFIRSIVSHIIISGCIALFVMFAYKLPDILKQSISEFVFLLIIFLILVILISFEINKYFKYKNAFITFNNYENDRSLISFDHTLHEAGPIYGYATLTKITAEIVFKSLKEIDNFHKEMIYFASRKKYILAGYIIEQAHYNSAMTIYVYSKNESVNILKKKFTSMGFRNINVNSINDEDYSEYAENLYPDIYNICTIYNRNIMIALEKNKIDFSQPIQIAYMLVFKCEADATNCAKDAIGSGYIKAKCDLVATEEDIVEDDEDEYVEKQVPVFPVYVQSSSPASLEHLNIQSRKIIDYAEKYNGELVDFNVGELIDETVFTEKGMGKVIVSDYES